MSKAARTEVAPATRKGMTDAHKEALALGRDEGRAVRRYLEALDARRPRPGRRRTVDSVARQLDETIGNLRKATAVDRVHLLQRRIDLEAELEALRTENNGDDAAVEKAFVEALPGYSRRKRISYAAWREVGVPARVLRVAGIRRGAS